MEGISKEDLENMLCSYDDSVTIAYITDKLLDACKELPDQQWQTIDEFKANGEEGWCWIYAQESVDHAWYYSDNFWLRDNSGTAYFYVTHVMPIKTPEVPK